ncbi:PAS domain S-box-containing protein/diguanylate cyclase (GGDEF) domain-containing protein [Kushneria avicenniae]|uniref:PAS domain S-box-containing protein/diguanylate cyclase (GGDEF) domain-containing protein n=1 Tax=Kushneria avicenniae TaxID=402385 RepID=A0A1I1IBW1_9GAMM|nr:EAL domain-containing protein [Kushneria avicenniae]SFC33694.1 PAS domain S-box-containing protein/diguanylate cyclase (GGDEF) domain-containing protein [Kushneria avicenniae]
MTVFYDHKDVPVLQQLLRSAAHAADCACSVFYGTGGDVVADYGSTPAAGMSAGMLVMLRQLIEGSGEGYLCIKDVRCLQAPLVDLPWPDNAVFAALTLVRSGSEALPGVLVVCDDRPRSGLSTAQRYVLHTHATQIAHYGDCHQVRESIEIANTSSSERLRLLESVAVHANDAILITEAEPIALPGPRIVYCNAAFTRTTGYTEADVIGKTPRILQNKRTDRKALDRLRNALEKWQPVEIELLNARRDGSEFWVELSIVPVANERGWFTHWVSVQRDISERKRAEEVELQARRTQAENMALEARLLERQRIEQELSWAATHDNLTELYNRAWIMGRLHELLSKAPSSQPEAAVLFMDLDRFKLVNDSLGHRAGDQLLTDMARRLESCLRSADTLARVGGDEFVVLIEDDTPERAAGEVAHRIAQSLQKPFRIQGQNIFSSSSIGIVVLEAHYHTPEELLRDADTAMYVAKEEGVGRYVFFTPSMRENVVETLALQNDLRHAMKRDEFTLCYQPIHEPHSRTIRGIEALLTWQHPKRGSVAPEVFIGMAEELGILRDIGHWVVHEACHQLAAWRRAHPGLCEHMTLNINVSAQELKHHSFTHDLVSALEGSGLPAHLLQLEINEGVFRHHPEIIGQILHDIRALGVSIVLDDFGTGYSALSYIDQYEIDAIKVDRAFVLRMVMHQRSMAIMQSLLWLGRTLGLDIVAEGVETLEQLEMLQALGCPLAQGYFLSRPMTPDQIDLLLSNRAERPAGARSVLPRLTPWSSADPDPGKYL